MSRSSIALNRSLSRRCVICLARLSPLSLLRFAAAVSRSCTSCVANTLILMILSPCCIGKAAWARVSTSRALSASRVAGTNGRRMTAQRRDGNLHIRIQRQGHQNVVKLSVAFHVEHAVVGVLACNAPDMAPLATTLQFLRITLLACFQFICLIGRHVGRNADIHAYVVEHCSLSLFRELLCDLLGAVAGKALYPVFVQFDAKAGTIRHGQFEIAVIERLYENF